MGIISIYGGTVSTGVALASSILGFHCLYQTNANPIQSPTTSPSTEISPTKKKVTSYNLENFIKTSAPKKLNHIKPAYTQRQIECAEIYGIDPLECTKLGQLVDDDSDFVIDRYDLLRKNHSFRPKKICARKLNVSENECNIHGIFTNRTEAMTKKIFEILDTDSWDDITYDDLNTIIELNLENMNITTLTEKDLDSLTSLKLLRLSNNQLTSISIPKTLNKLNWLFIDNNRLTSIKISSRLSKLIWINLANNRLRSFKIHSSLQNLVWLFLNDNQLKSLYLPKTLDALSELRLNNNQLTSLTIPRTLINLFWVFLNDNQLRSFTLPDTLSSLNILNLRNNLLETLIIPNNSKELTSLDVTNNLLSKLAIPEDITDQLDPILLLKALFTNISPKIKFNKHCKITLNKVDYNWMDIQTVFKTAITFSTKTYDVLQIKDSFIFENSKQLSENQIKFITDLIETIPLPYPNLNRILPINQRKKTSLIGIKTNDTLSPYTKYLLALITILLSLLGLTLLTSVYLSCYHKKETCRFLKI